MKTISRTLKVSKLITTDGREIIYLGNYDELTDRQKINHMVKNHYILNTVDSIADVKCSMSVEEFYSLSRKEYPETDMPHERCIDSVMFEEG